MMLVCAPCRCAVSSSRSIETTTKRSIFNSSSSSRSSNIKDWSALTRYSTRGNLSFGKTRTTRARVVPEEYASSAIPPANEIAGFVVGFLMLYVVVQASKLDAIIAEAQARGLARKREDDDDEEEGDFGDQKWMSFSALDEKDATVERVKRGKGNVFILPPESTSDATKE
jgi:hypothetical protein